MVGGMLRILIPSLLLLVAAMLWFARVDVPPPELATELAAPRELPELTLTDHDGRSFGTADFEGGFTLMFFGFTNCPDICPISLQVLATAVRAMREKAIEPLPDVVLVSVDPARDSPERLREYLAHFDPGFIGVTGPRENLAPLLEQFGVTVMRQSLAGENYNMTHSPQVFVIGPRAELIAIMRRAENADDVVRDYLRIRQRYSNGSLGRPASS